MNKNYKSLIFTDHALERMDTRSISKDMVFTTVENASKKYPGKSTTKFIKTVSNRTVHVVAQYLEDEKKWLIISVWVRGEDDPTPIAWRIITFPFWLVWKLLHWLYKKLF